MHAYGRTDSQKDRIPVSWRVGWFPGEWTTLWILLLLTVDLDLKSTTRNGIVKELKSCVLVGGIPVSYRREHVGFPSLWWMVLIHQLQLWISRRTCCMIDCNYRTQTFRWCNLRGLSHPQQKTGHARSSRFCGLSTFVRNGRGESCQKDSQTAYLVW